MCIALCRVLCSLWLCGLLARDNNVPLITTSLNRHNRQGACCRIYRQIIIDLFPSCPWPGACGEQHPSALELSGAQTSCEQPDSIRTPPENCGPTLRLLVWIIKTAPPLAN